MSVRTMYMPVIILLIVCGCPLDDASPENTRVADPLDSTSPTDVQAPDPTSDDVDGGLDTQEAGAEFDEEGDDGSPSDLGPGD